MGRIYRDTVKATVPTPRIAKKIPPERSAMTRVDPVPVTGIFGTAVGFSVFVGHVVAATPGVVPASHVGPNVGC